MREINVSIIKEVVKNLCMSCNYNVDKNIRNCFLENIKVETNNMAKEIIDIYLKNQDLAREENIPICQDTGMVILFLDIGQEVHLVGGNIKEAINLGVAQGYEEGYLRKSIVLDPINRINTKNNTPAVIHFNIVEGNNIRIRLLAKGFGSENMSKLKMLKPSDGYEGIKNFILETVKEAGPNACPPIIVGVGIGGTMEKCALIAKEATIRSLTDKNEDPFWAKKELELLEEINKLNIGPAGFGGNLTSMGVKINTYPTHIAGLPVAVNISCHVTRHEEKII